MVVLAIVLVACGGDDDATETSTSLPVADTTATSAPAAAGNGDDVVDVGETVRVDYIGTLDDGEQFDSSFDRGDQLEFVAGTGQMIPGFDAAVVGMTVGETETVTIPAADAYGERDEAAIVEFPLEEVPEQFRVEGTQVDLGNGLPATVVEVTDSVVRVDTNHPLAGEALTFEITVVEIVD
jgi:FKBP-type peptidyl-prolyl cis-trans isomerase 2